MISYNWIINSCRFRAEQLRATRADKGRSARAGLLRDAVRLPGVRRTGTAGPEEVRPPGGRLEHVGINITWGSDIAHVFFSPWNRFCILSLSKSKRSVLNKTPCFSHRLSLDSSYSMYGTYWFFNCQLWSGDEIW